MTAELALLRVMVGGVSWREPVYCVAPWGRAVFGMRYGVLTDSEGHYDRELLLGNWIKCTLTMCLPHVSYEEGDRGLDERMATPTLAGPQIGD